MTALLSVPHQRAAVKSQVRLFADNCLLYRTIKSFEDHFTLQKDLDNLQAWATD